MKTLCLLAVSAAGLLSTTVSAHDTEIGFDRRGACEAASAAMSQGEQDWLLDAFPDLFDTEGEAASFLTKAWTCDRSSKDGKYYITDHIEEILASRWYERRNH